MMRLGIAVSQLDPWYFFQDIYADLKTHYNVDVFEFQPIKTPILYERINHSFFNRRLAAYMRSHDVVFFEWASGLLAAATKLPKECNIVTRLHRYELFEWTEKINWSRVDKIIFVSHTMLRKYAEKFPEHSHKAVVIPVGISLNKFQPSNKRFSGDIGILCDLAPRKRVYDLILTFYELHQVRKDLHLHIVGGDVHGFEDYTDAMVHLVKRLDLKNHVTFYGKMNEVSNWYKNIDIFVSNSYSEGMQVAPMEAMASGCYCLSHQWEGAEELLPEDNLYFTHSELIDKILRFSGLDEADQQRERAYMRDLASERFDIEDVKVRIRGVIEEVGVKNN